MILSSRPKLSDLYTLSQSKLLENYTFHSSTNLYSPYMAVSPPGGGGAFIYLNPYEDTHFGQTLPEKAIKGCNLREKRRHSIGMIRIWISDPREITRMM